MQHALHSSLQQSVVDSMQTCQCRRHICCYLSQRKNVQQTYDNELSKRAISSDWFAAVQMPRISLILALAEFSSNHIVQPPTQGPAAAKMVLLLHSWQHPCPYRLLDCRPTTTAAGPPHAAEKTMLSFILNVKHPACDRKTLVNSDCHTPSHHACCASSPCRIYMACQRTNPDTAR
jgi:hypothetical protein